MSDAVSGVNPLSANLCEMKVEINHHEVAVEGDCKTLLQILELEILTVAVLPWPWTIVWYRVTAGLIPSLSRDMKITVIRAVCGG